MSQSPNNQIAQSPTALANRLDGLAWKLEAYAHTNGNPPFLQHLITDQRAIANTLRAHRPRRRPTRRRK
jgi:hypothetical protein